VGSSSTNRLSSRLAFAAVALGLVTTEAKAAITYTCDASIGTTICNSLNTTIAGLYSSVFSDATARIYITFGNTGLGASSTIINNLSYTNWRNDLNAQPKDADDITAFSNVPATPPSPPFPGFGSMELTNANERALGLTANSGMNSAGTTGCTVSLVSDNGCYDAVVTISSAQNAAGNLWFRTGTQGSNQYDFFSVVEHETDEVLGTSSCLGTSSGTTVDACGGFLNSRVAPVDMFRYTANGTRIFLSSGPAYFSIDGGATQVAPYNNTPNGEDFADFSTNCQHVQDAVGCPGQSFDVSKSVELKILDVIGYDEIQTPEPSSVALMGAGMAGLLALSRRRW
jgi:PEP-CTERM motif